MRTTPRTLEQMHRYGTAWEIVMIHEGREERVGFTERKTKHSLAAAVQSIGDRICSLLSPAELEAEYRYTKLGGFDFGSVQVRFGRTERECASSI